MTHTNWLIKTCFVFLVTAPLLVFAIEYVILNAEEKQKNSIDTVIKNTPNSNTQEILVQSENNINEFEPKETFSHRVINIEDGDTILVTDLKETLTIRLACIDAPELKQVPYGLQSKQRLQLFLPIDSIVNLKQQTVDRYDRIVAEVIKDEININLAMVAEGQAVAYRKYLSQCESKKYLTAEETAKAKGLAYWSQINPVMPWDFRRGKHKIDESSTVSRNGRQEDQCDASYPEACIPSPPPKLTCKDIPNREFIAKEPDPHGFDRDRDGVACES